MRGNGPLGCLRKVMGIANPNTNNFLFNTTVPSLSKIQLALLLKKEKDENLPLYNNAITSPTPLSLFNTLHQVTTLYITYYARTFIFLSVTSLT